ncbi:MAG: hypothetical protein HC834_00020 [Rhodospirillales bacterium]|nr:hypothetical protein [Rhodospirillales bacterium]
MGSAIHHPLIANFYSSQEPSRCQLSAPSQSEPFIAVSLIAKDLIEFFVTVPGAVMAEAVATRPLCKIEITSLLSRDCAMDVIGFSIASDGVY